MRNDILALDDKTKESVIKFFLNKNYQIGINYLSKKLEKENLSNSLNYFLLDIYMDLPYEIQRDQLLKKNIAKKFPNLINKIEKISETNIDKFLNTTENFLTKLVSFKELIGTKINEFNGFVKKVDSAMEEKFYKIVVFIFGEDINVENERKRKELEEFLLIINTKTSEIKMKISDKTFATKFDLKKEKELVRKFEDGFEELGIIKKQNAPEIKRIDDDICKN